MGRAGVATAASQSFTEPGSAEQYLARRDGPYVVKADGLTGGKGVLVTDSRIEAVNWVNRWLASGSVVVEDFLEGPEVSVFAVCTDLGAALLEPARDYKRLLDDDRGPNTGGMGAYSPIDDLPAGLLGQALRAVVEPTLAQMAEEGNPFRGFLYAGLILTPGGPQVLEFNVRLGDPETQAILPRLESDLVDVLEGAVPTWSDQTTVNVVLAARGYPESPFGGDVIQGLHDIPNDVLVFHSGTRRDGKRLLVDGGRVLSLVGAGDSTREARDRAYEAVSAVTWPGMQFRTDVAGVPQS
jgi:phosphoribosylamine--glycine ligase